MIQSIAAAAAAAGGGGGGVTHRASPHHHCAVTIDDRTSAPVKHARSRVPSVVWRLSSTRLLLTVSMIVLALVPVLVLALHYYVATTSANPTVAVSVADLDTGGECVRSFVNRSHTLNDGVSISIGLFSVWDRAATRHRIRDTIKRWIPATIDIRHHCDHYGLDIKPDPGLSINSTICGDDGEPVPLSGAWWSVYDNIQFHFVVGKINPNHPNYQQSVQALATEQSLYGDIQVLDVDENMNSGKSLHWFRTVAADNRRRATTTIVSDTADYHCDYVMKLDDDSYLHLPNLIAQARQWRQRNLSEVYYGFAKHSPHERPPIVQPSMVTFYHSGMGYLMSADIVDWLLTDDAQTVINNTVGEGISTIPNTAGAGHEDLNWGLWLTERGRMLGRNESELSYQLYKTLVHNFINGQPGFYSYPGHTNNHWAQATQFSADTVLVHELKDGASYSNTVRHFMCGQPHQFDWDSNRKFWLDRRSWYHSFYLYHNNGSIKDQREWWNDFGQSFREDWHRSHSDSVSAVD